MLPFVAAACHDAFASPAEAPLAASLPSPTLKETRSDTTLGERRTQLTLAPASLPEMPAVVPPRAQAQAGVPAPIKQIGVLLGTRPLAIVDQKSHRLSGIAADYLQLIGMAVNVRWQIWAYADRATMLDAVRTGEIDAAVGIDASKPNALDRSPQARQEHGIWTTEPFARAKASLFAAPTLDLSTGLANKVLMYSGTPTLARAIERHFPRATLKRTHSGYQGLEQVALGEADAYIGDARILQSYKDAPLFETLRNRVDIDAGWISYAFLVASPLSEMAQTLNAGINAISAPLRQTIDQTDAIASAPASQFLPEAASATNHAVESSPAPLSLILSAEQRAWRDAHPVVRVAVPTSVIPFAFENDRGHFSGITASVLNLIASRTGLHFEPVFSGSIDAMRQSVIDGHADLAVLGSVAQQEPPGSLRYSRPFMFTTAGIVTRQSENRLRDLPSLIGKPIALVNGQPLTHYVLERGIATNDVRLTGSGIDALERVAAGQVDATVLYFATANFLISQYYSGVLKVSGTTGPSAIPVQFALSSDAAILGDIIDQAIKVIPSESIDAVAQQWMHFSPAPLLWTPPRNLLHVLAVIASVTVLGFIVWNARLRLRISARRRQSAVLEQRVQFLRRLIDANPIPTYVRDGHGVLIECNQALCDAMSLPASALLGKTVYAIPGLDEISRHRILEARTALAAGAEKYFETLSLNINGARIDGVHWAVPLDILTANDAQHGMSGMLGGWIDLTQLKQMEVALREAKDAAEAANHAKTLFMATISHEIRTPMNVIIGVLELLQVKPGDASNAVTPSDALYDQRAQQARLAYRSATSLMTLLNDILEFSRAEIDQMPLHKMPNCLKSEIQEVVDFFLPTAEEKGLALCYDIDQNTPDTLLFDAGRLRQILNNLISNAIKFTAQGSVAVSLRARKCSDLDSNPQICHIALAVSDTGPGIPDAEQAKLFQPFQQSSDEVYARYGGAGMGLAICQRIADAMSGKITLSSTLGKGTTMTLEAPLIIACDAFGATENALPPAPDLTFRLTLAVDALVLIVDDHEANRLLLSTQLSQLGIASRTAADGHQALLLMTEHVFDAVITDCNMPDLDGFALASTIHVRHGAHIPIIGYSADASIEIERRCLAAGMLGRLVKPVTLDHLQQHFVTEQLRDMPTVPQQLATMGTRQTEANDMQVLNNHAIARLLQLSQRNHAMADRLLSLFEQSLHDTDAAYRHAARIGDLVALRQYAHHHNGPAKMLGLDDFADACDRLYIETHRETHCEPHHEPHRMKHYDAPETPVSSSAADNQANAGTSALKNALHAYDLALSKIHARLPHMHKALQTATEQS